MFVSQKFLPVQQSQWDGIREHGSSTSVQRQITVKQFAAVVWGKP